MVIKKVQLKALGNKGLIVSVLSERTISDQLSAKRKNDIEEYLPLPIPLRQKFYRLKYFFLIMIGIWRDEWSELLLDDFSGLRDVADLIEESGLEGEEATNYGTSIAKVIMAADTCLSKTTINGYEVDGVKVKINGEYEAIDEKPYNPKLQFISEEDDYSFFSETVELMEEISTDVMNYIREENVKLEDVKEMLIQLNKSDSEIERINNQNEEENYLEMVNLLSDQGVFIPLPGSQLEKQLEENAGHSKPEIASNKTVDQHSFKSSEEIPTDEEHDPNEDVGSQEDHDLPPEE